MHQTTELPSSAAPRGQDYDQESEDTGNGDGIMSTPEHLSPPFSELTIRTRHFELELGRGNVFLHVGDRTGARPPALEVFLPFNRRRWKDQAIIGWRGRYLKE